MGCQCPANAPPIGTRKKNKGKQREQSLPDMSTPPPHHPASPAELDSTGNHKIWGLSIRGRGKDSISTKTAPPKKRDHSPEVFEVPAVRGFQVSFGFILPAFLFLLGITEICCNEAETQEKIIDSDERHSSHRSARK